MADREDNKTSKRKTITRQIYVDIESGKIKKLTLSDTFKFECNKCGRCCHNIDVLLTSYDIMRLCDNLNIKSSEFLQKYGHSYLGPESGLPVTTIEFKDDGSCPFLSSNGCNTYKDRPGACRSYPIGRMIDTNNKNAYFLMPTSEYCSVPSTEKTYTLQDWLDKNKIGSSDYKILNVICQVLYDFDHILLPYAEKHYLPIPKSHGDKFSMIERLTDELVDIITNARADINARRKNPISLSG
jgi:Fe-S-cluster containining protein